MLKGLKQGIYIQTWAIADQPNKNTILLFENFLFHIFIGKTNPKLDLCKYFVVFALKCSYYTPNYVMGVLLN